MAMGLGSIPGVTVDFLGEAVAGLDVEFLPFGDKAEFTPFGTAGTSVLSLGRDTCASLSRASGGDLEGKFMTCSRNGTE
jgi:hypothetical protein